MVHALKMLSELIVQGGLLIDIHPANEAPVLAVAPPGEYLLAGYLEEQDDRQEYIFADAAIEEAIERGWYVLEKQEMIEFITHAASLDALLDYFDKYWSDAIIPQKTRRTILRLFKSTTNPELLLTENVLISRLRNRYSGLLKVNTK